MSIEQKTKLMTNFTKSDLADKVIQYKKLAHEAEAKANNSVAEITKLKNIITGLNSANTDLNLRIKAFEADFRNKRGEQQGADALNMKQLEIYRRKLMEQIEGNVLLQSSIELGLIKDSDGGFFGELPSE